MYYIHLRTQIEREKIGKLSAKTDEIFGKFSDSTTKLLGKIFPRTATRLSVSATGGKTLAGFRNRRLRHSEAVK